MKIKRPQLLIVLLALCWFACDEDDATPVKDESLRASKMIYGDSYRILTYDDQDRVIKVTNGVVTGSGNFESFNTFSYEGSKLKEAVLSEEQDWKLVYTYEGNNLVETKEYVEEELTQIHKFTYDAAGNVTSWTANQQVMPEEEEFVPVGRSVYTYNANNNATEVKQYGFINDEPFLISTIQYSNFDSKKNSETLFFSFAFHPFMATLKNNPGTSKAFGDSGEGITQHYTYTYNSEGYSVKQLFTGSDYFVEYQFINE